MINTRELDRVSSLGVSTLYISDIWSIYTLYLTYPRCYVYKSYYIISCITSFSLGVICNVIIFLFTKSKIRKEIEKLN